MFAWMGGGSSSGGGGEADRETVISQIEDLEGEVHHVKDTLSGVRTPFTFDASRFEKVKVKELQKLVEKLEAQLEELKEQEEAQIGDSFQKSPLRRSIASFGGAASAPDVPDAATATAEMLFGQESHWGLNWDNTYRDSPGGPATEDLRRRRREGTKKKVSEELRVHFGREVPLGPHFEKSVGRDTVLFVDNSRAVQMSNIASAGGAFLLGRYDVLVTKVWADLDRNWDFIKGTKNRFWIAHAAALNIGESIHATDFYDFCIQDNNAPGNAMRLSDEAYLQAMEHIMMNIVYAANHMTVEHFIFFPFGMGAFLRNLGRLDSRFVDWQELQQLRRKLASAFIRVLAHNLNPRARIYLCLMFGDWEPQCNSDAFLRALVEGGHDPAIRELRSRVTICAEGDCLQMAQDLGARSDHVMLVNGANRMLFGNHWFDGRAKRAIDENMHRRSWRMAATSYLLNNYGRRIQERRPDDLQNNVRAIRGTVHDIRWQ